MHALTSPSARSDIFMFFGIDCKFSTEGKIAFAFIKTLHIYIGNLIRVFSNHNSHLPNKLIFYSIGPDDESFQKVLDNELQAIQRACQELYGYNQIPQICFVLIKKRHRTVIDTNIVSPNGFEFYLNSHATIQGTSLPMFYQVLDNEIAFISDDIQQLTY
ncbi:unnamed protein product [Rotaria sp. Silwood1]|nr:unnamed protein product [Rotaria sp. Silwood1]CAF0906248.1 unnamed protein product [Rotaria sp. Silwood1]